MKKISEKIKPSLIFLRTVVDSFNEHECALRAASLAYYGLFAIFPLILFLIYLGSAVLTSESAREILNTYLEQAFPINTTRIQIVVDQTMRARRSIGIVGSLGLVWSASSVFGGLESALNVIWGGAGRPFWKRRIIAATSVLALSGLFISSLTLWPITTWLISDKGIAFNKTFNGGIGFGLVVVTCFLLFRFFPNQKIPWRPAMAGAVVAGVLIEIAKAIFGWYLASAFANFGYVYGSLAWLVALALWTYLVSVLFFLGAEFGANLHARKET